MRARVDIRIDAQHSGSGLSTRRRHLGENRTLFLQLQIELADPCIQRILQLGPRFADAREKLKTNGLDELVISEAKRGKLLMGICLGMQLLFDRSYEYGITEGLGLIKGEVRPIADIIPKGYKIPHIGWNGLRISEYGRKSEVFKYTSEGDHVYFVHSFAGMDCSESLIAGTEYGALLTAAVARDNVFGMQFHPEKSGETGLKILKAFCEIR